jgi:DNA repair protein RecN (Recombination protein N)
MIERFYLQNNLSFKDVDLQFKGGLTLFTGASGAGKSVLLNAILSTIGQKDVYSEVAEVTFDSSIDLEEFGVESEDITIFKQMKKGRLRFFVNSQSVSKKVISDIGKLFISHLNPREIKEFESEYLLEILDLIVAKSSDEYSFALGNYRDEFSKFEELEREISKIGEEIERLSEREDFISFEIERIETIAPEEGEDEKLQLTKKRLSKKDKIESYIEEVEVIFEKRMALFEIFDLMGLEEDGERIENLFEDIKSKLEDIEENLSELDEIDVETVLDRIETISELKTKYGSVDKALQYRDDRVHELERLAQLRKELNELEEKKEEIISKLSTLGDAISEERGSRVWEFEEILNSYLSLLNLGTSKLERKEREFSRSGVDEISLKIGSTDVENLSYGEQNRVRLAILSLKTKFSETENGILFLDEVDANLSGDESMRVAQVLKDLSKGYQIFAISHQPQLTSKADQHFVIYKDKNGESGVRELKSLESRAEEITRMVGGSVSGDEVRNFAMKLLEAK